MVQLYIINFIQKYILQGDTQRSYRDDGFENISLSAMSPPPDSQQVTQAEVGSPPPHRTAPNDPSATAADSETATAPPNPPISPPTAPKPETLAEELARRRDMRTKARSKVGFTEQCASFQPKKVTSLLNENMSAALDNIMNPFSEVDPLVLAMKNRRAAMGGDEE